MRRSPAVLAIAALSAAWLAAAGCSHEVEGRGDDRTPGASTPAYGDTFVHAFISDIAGLIPNITSDAASHEVGDRIYDGLVSNDKDLNWTGQLAESWQFSPDCLTLTFNLRRNVRWHDGHPFTADDVRFTYEAMINPKTPTGYRDDFLQVKSLEVLDPYTVRITYPRPHARALQTWGMNMLPKHLLAQAVAEGKLKEAKQNSRPVGTGAYRFQEWKSGEKVVLVANPDYYGGRPYIGRLVYRIIPSQGTIFLELKAKGVDVASLTALQYMRQTEYPAFRKAFHKFRYPSGGYTYLGFNLKDPRFADRRVRWAFAHAIDKRELIDGVVLGLAREATGPLRPGTWPWTDKVKRYEHDVAKAKALLAEAGWVDRNGDGVVEDKDGKPFKFTIRTNQGNDERKKVAEIIQQRLKDVGVVAEIQIIEWSAFIKEFIKKRQFEAIVMGWSVPVDPDQFVVWHSSEARPEGLNNIQYANPEVDQLLEAGRASCVQSERLKYYHRLQEVLAEDLPLVFLYFRDALPAVAGRVRGVDPGAAGILYNIDKWYVPTSLQRYTSG
jgi:peptide/nickel transport system substrate-binding protein